MKQGTAEVLLKHFLLMAVSYFCRSREFIHTSITDFFFCWTNICRLNILKLAINFIILILRTQLKMSAKALKIQSLHVSKVGNQNVEGFILLFPKQVSGRTLSQKH